MAAFATDPLHELLLRLAPQDGARPSHLSGPRAHAAYEAQHDVPMLYRSEGFAEDLFESHPLAR